MEKSKLEKIYIYIQPDGLFSGAAPLGAGGAKGGMSNGQPLPKAAEAVIKRSLLVGNFEAAVQCCMSTGNMADAMLLARCVCIALLFFSFRLNLDVILLFFLLLSTRGCRVIYYMFVC